MLLFVGKHINKIDSKGRVSVPKAFRAALQMNGIDTIYVYPQFKYNALEACDEDFMNRLSSSLNQMALFSDDHDDLASVILASAHLLVFDTEGRVVFPKALLEHANLSEDAVFIGQGARFQVWEPQAFEKFSEITFRRARERKAKGGWRLC